MRTIQHANSRPRAYSSWRRRQILRRRKEKGRLIVAVLERLYGEDQARIMWGSYLRSKLDSVQTEQATLIAKRKYPSFETAVCHPIALPMTGDK